MTQIRNFHILRDTYGVMLSFKYDIKFPRSRGDSGALYLQSATAGVMVNLGVFFVESALGK